MGRLEFRDGLGQCDEIRSKKGVVAVSICYTNINVHHSRSNSF